MAASDKPITPEEAARLHAAMHEASVHGAAHGAAVAPGGVDLLPLQQRPDFVQKAVDFVTMIDENGLLERFAEELDALAAEDAQAEDGEPRAQ